jgi:hypothetical protein
MICTKRSVRLADQIWSGQCQLCLAEFEAKRSELEVQTDHLSNTERAVTDCTECGKMEAAVVFYPKSEA